MLNAQYIISTNLEQKMEQKNYFNDLITNDEHFHDIPDCISSCVDYKELIEKSFLLTNGLLNLESFVCSEETNKYLFHLTVNHKFTEFQVNIVSDYVDANNLIAGLNFIIINSGVKTEKRFIDLVGGPVDFGVAFISKDKEMNLAKNGMIWRDDQFYIDFDKTNNSHDIDKSLTRTIEPQNKPWWKVW
ncbi:MAG TPA: hypothetical protein PLU58_09925 [Saprospiraceae bacterium]|nr:hypothetical protein [Saprospiraceae bacterium]